MRLSNKLAVITGSIFLTTIGGPANAQRTSLPPGIEYVVAKAPDCATADKKMMAMAKSVASMPATGDLDHDFAAMAAANARMMADAAKMEMACTKKTEMRQMAEAVEKQTRDVLHNLQIGTGTTH